MKETYNNRQIRFSVLSHGEPSFLDLEGWTGGVWHWIFFSLGFQPLSGHPYVCIVQAVVITNYIFYNLS